MSKSDLSEGVQRLKNGAPNGYSLWLTREQADAVLAELDRLSNGQRSCELAVDRAVSEVDSAFTMLEKFVDAVGGQNVCGEHTTAVGGGESNDPWANALEIVQGFAAERDKLQAFKDYVRARLDAAGVPTDPESPHKAEGCRIGGRLDAVFAELDALREAVKHNADEPAWVATREPYYNMVGFDWRAAPVEDFGSLPSWVPGEWFHLLEGGKRYPKMNPECVTYPTREAALSALRDAVAKHKAIEGGK